MSSGGAALPLSDAAVFLEKEMFIDVDTKDTEYGDRINKIVLFWAMMDTANEFHVPNGKKRKLNMKEGDFLLSRVRYYQHNQEEILHRMAKEKVEWIKEHYTMLASIKTGNITSFQLVAKDDEAN